MKLAFVMAKSKAKPRSQTSKMEIFTTVVNSFYSSVKQSDPAHFPKISR